MRTFLSRDDEMEGPHVSAGTLADAGEGVSGRVDSGERVPRYAPRYGLV